MNGSHVNIFSAHQHEHGSRDVTRQNDDPPAPPPVSLVEGLSHPFFQVRAPTASHGNYWLLGQQPVGLEQMSKIPRRVIRLIYNRRRLQFPAPPFACPVPAITGEARLRSNLSPAAQEEHQAPLLLMPRSIDFHELRAVGWRT